jgi:predicted Holliday junction resolvase-like endonuclease
MSVIEDVRKVVQDLVAPELKSISVRLDGFERESKLRDEALATKIESAERESKLRDEALATKVESWQRESKLRDEITQARIDIVRDSLGARIDALGAKMDGQYASIMNALDLNRRVETLERDKQQPASA